MFIISIHDKTMPFVLTEKRLILLSQSLFDFRFCPTHTMRDNRYTEHINYSFNSKNINSDHTNKH